jgi:hypothetical protein
VNDFQIIPVAPINLLKPTGYAMHQLVFKVQQLYALPTLFMGFVFI